MVSWSEAIILPTFLGASMEKICLFWVSRLLDDAFETIVEFKNVSDTDAPTKPQPQSPYTFMKISLYIILLTRNSIWLYSAFTCSHLHLELL